MVFSFIKRMNNAQKERIRKRLAIAYAAIAWNGFAFCIYFFAKRDKEKTGLPIGLHEAATSRHTEKVKVLRFEGLSLVEEHNYDKEEIEEARNMLETKRQSENDF